MKMKSFLSNALCILILCTGYTLTSCIEGPIDNEDLKETEDKEYVDMGTAAYRIDELTATTATFTGNLKVTAAELQSPSQVTVYYTSGDVLDFDTAKSVSTTSFGPNQEFEIVLRNLLLDTKYKYCVLIDVISGKTYSEVSEFSTSDVDSDFSVTSKTATTASFSCKVTGLSKIDLFPYSSDVQYTATNVSCKGFDLPIDEEMNYVTVGIMYSTEEDAVRQGIGDRLIATEISSDGSFTLTINNLNFGTKYYVSTFADQNVKALYGEIKEFSTDNVACELSVSEVTGTKASLTGNITGVSDEDRSSLAFGIIYSKEETVSQGKGTKVEISDIASDGSFSVQLSGLDIQTRYYYCSYILRDGNAYNYSSPKEFTTPTLYGKDYDFSTASEFADPANCFIVSKSGLYKFRTVKGNSSESVGTVASADVLWESFGTDVKPDYTDLIKGICHKSGYIAFETASPLLEGNAVICAKDSDGNILWSWHIWMTDEPQEQTYNNGAGILLDRNLGATSAKPGDVGALGLLYQWGRKDPFLSASAIDGYNLAESTLTWPIKEESTSSIGTIEYSIAHPTTFIVGNSKNRDWYYTGDSSTDNSRWKSSKTIYDPCPGGWRVPTGGDNGVWAKAFETTEEWGVKETYTNWDTTNLGMDFSKTEKTLGSSGPIWYPSAGCRSCDNGVLWEAGKAGFYWTVSYYQKSGYLLCFSKSNTVEPTGVRYRAYGCSVRCTKE